MALGNAVTAQAARVADSTSTWRSAGCRDALDELRLDARLLGVDRLYALSPGADDSAVPAKDVVVLTDADASSWSSWNRYAEQFAADTGARLMRTDDGGVTGPVFYEHIRRLARPVLNNPKGQDAAQPRDLARRPIVAPTPLWTWSLVWRRDEDRATVRAVIDVLTCDMGSRRPRCRGMAARR